MGLTGLPLLVLSVVLAIGAPVACLFLWNRMKGRIAVVLRLVMIAMCQGLALLLGGVGVNDHYQFYASWSDLFGGGTGADTAIEALGPQGGSRPDFQPQRSQGRDVYSAVVTGERSGVHARVLVWLPPGYDAPANARRTYPVVELLPGYPGSPSTWFHAVHAVPALKAAMKAGRSQPFILVAPTTTVVPGRDTECVDFPNGPRAETWLTDDVRTAVTSAFRADQDRSSWGLMGFSTGGYCAAKMAVRRPDLFAAAVTIQGDTTPQTPEVQGDSALYAQNSIPELLRNRRPPVQLLLAGTRQDRQSNAELNELVPLVQPPTQAFVYVLNKGGHNAPVWNSMLPRAYSWLSARLTTPGAKNGRDAVTGRPGRSPGITISE
jgi:enterochelin esterase-like enzyme